MHCRYINEVSQALHYFNMARRDSDWGERAVFQMVEICLNPDKDLLVGEVLKTTQSEPGAGYVETTTCKHVNNNNNDNNMN